jgi:hypothetical protein
MRENKGGQRAIKIQESIKNKVEVHTPNMTVLLVFLRFVILPFAVSTSYSWCVTYFNKIKETMPLDNMKLAHYLIQKMETDLCCSRYEK